MEIERRMIQVDWLCIRSITLPCFAICAIREIRGYFPPRPLKAIWTRFWPFPRTNWPLAASCHRHKPHVFCGNS